MVRRRQSTANLEIKRTFSRLRSCSIVPASLTPTAILRISQLLP